VASRRERRCTCLWLATVASWRGGVIGRVCRACGGLDAALDQPRERLAAIIATRPAAAFRAKAGASEEGAAADAEREARLELAAFAAALADPQATAVASSGAAVTFVDGLYPRRLEHLHDPPPALFVLGAGGLRTLRLLAARPVVAVVGTRAPSAYGREMAAAVAGGLARAGVVVVSGLAAGIDSVAHMAALEASPHATATVAVLGCGPDVVYPRSNLRLYERIRREGLIVSEFVWGVPARAWRFPARNRVMAGISDALVVVEGTERSGSLITADFMLDLGRPVLAVPGEAGRRLSAGPHRLLRDGARICESAADVLAALELEPLTAAPGGGEDPGADDQGGPGPNGARAAVLLAALDRAESSVDELAGVAELPVRETLTLLAELELDGVVRPVAGGRYRLVRGRRR
jgi:DNA processing protein